MPKVRYEQLATKADFEESSSKPKWKCFDSCLRKSALSFSLILLYFSLSIGLTFYQRWLLKDFHYPLTVVLYHLIVKWILSVIIKCILRFGAGVPQLILPFVVCLRSVGPTGLASGIDVGFSNWSLELVTISLYTMTKSTTIIFILGFAILMGLEKKSWSLVGIVCMISVGLVMFTYKATQFNLLGFNFLLLASFAAGLRWTFAQVLMQKTKLGLHNPIDMVFHVQPWMFLSVLPFMITFEGFDCFRYLDTLQSAALVSTMIKISVGATIAFAMELSEFLVVTYTSSLTLSIAGIFKEMWILVLAVEVSGDQLSAINVVGLSVCLLGITGHIAHKLYIIKLASNAMNVVTDGDYQIEPINTRNRRNGLEIEEPLINEEDGKKNVESDSDDASNILFQVVQRRDMDERGKNEK